jgi:hypothetical protein
MPIRQDRRRLAAQVREQAAYTLLGKECIVDAVDSTTTRLDIPLLPVRYRHHFGD